jgi:hypothetical protein
MLVRLKGAHGCWAWVVPDYTVLTHPSLSEAHCLHYGPDVTMIATAADTRAGALGQLLVMAQCKEGVPPIPDRAIATLAEYVSDKSTTAREGYSRPPRAIGDNTPRGERHPRAKLTEAILEQCRAMRAAGETERAISERFGVSASTIHRALAGQTWRTNTEAL